MENKNELNFQIFTGIFTLKPVTENLLKHPISVRYPVTFPQLYWKHIIVTLFVYFLTHIQVVNCVKNVTLLDKWKLD